MKKDQRKTVEIPHLRGEKGNEENSSDVWIQNSVLQLQDQSEKMKEWLGSYISRLKDFKVMIEEDPGYTENGVNLPHRIFYQIERILDYCFLFKRALSVDSYEFKNDTN